MKVGFVGLGNMGIGMAASLLKAGHELTVYNRTAAKSEVLVQQGAIRAADVADASSGDVVITMLADDAAVESVVFGNDGIIAALRTGGIHVSASTISVALSDKLTAAHKDRGQYFVSAPVFGRPEAAAAAKLFVVAAGPANAVDACQPLFRRHGTTHLPFWRESFQRESSEAQRKFPNCFHNRSAQRGPRSDRQGRRG